MKRYVTLGISIPDPTPEEQQVESQARRDREALVHALFHHPWLIAMAEGDWRGGSSGPDASPPAPPAAKGGGKPLTPLSGTAALAAARQILGGAPPAAEGAPVPRAAARQIITAQAPADQAPGDPIDHPAHYTSHPSGIEPIAITRHESFTRGNAIKYLMRAGRKDPDPRLDLRKARRYIDFELEDLER